ncbi:hypothetical protein VN97_g12600 [Penicillium thymicola]|uniref:Uncharacterized protein n=1 Tax=Penicillium thymicola TaxID=293382 RepID=A0AAI9T6M6_PENTH|nr:hypothetical protein VN97_g12600 [Penicillium thymicola]
MNLKLVPEQISLGRAFANSREPAKMLKILGNSPRSLNTGIVHIAWAPGMSKILKQTQIHMNWNILELISGILENCVVCGEASAQLYLPTMERICHPCVHDG